MFNPRQVAGIFVRNEKNMKSAKRILLALALSAVVCSPLVIAQDEPSKPALGDFVYVKMSTSLGDMVLELNHAKAPVTVENFIQYVDSGFYEGTVFHRIIKDFMAQGGGMDAEYKQKETKPPIKNEADNGLKNTFATIAMARTGDPNSATSQFFINTVDNARLDHTAKSQSGWGYCVFGKLIDGLDTFDKIRNTPVHKDPRADASQPAAADTPVAINKVTRVDAGQYKDIVAASRKAEQDAAAKAAQAAAGAFDAALAMVTAKGGDVSKGKKTASGLWVLDVADGSGEIPAGPSAKVTVHYSGWLPEGTAPFDSSVERGEPATFGLNQVIKGWTEGVGSMKTGGKRFLIVPPELGYGSAGRAPKIPGNATLVFQIELLSTGG